MSTNNEVLNSNIEARCIHFFIELQRLGTSACEVVERQRVPERESRNCWEMGFECMALAVAGDNTGSSFVGSA